MNSERVTEKIYVYFDRHFNINVVGNERSEKFSQNESSWGRNMIQEFFREDH